MDETGQRTKVAFTRRNPRRKTSFEAVIGSTINTEIPCYGENEDRLIIASDNLFESQLDFDIEKENPIDECPALPWRDQEPETDDRYSVTGYVTLKTLQESNGVYEAI